MRRRATYHGGRFRTHQTCEDEIADERDDRDAAAEIDSLKARVNRRGGAFAQGPRSVQRLAEHHDVSDVAPDESPTAARGICLLFLHDGLVRRLQQVALRMRWSSAKLPKILYIPDDLPPELRVPKKSSPTTTTTRRNRARSPKGPRAPKAGW